MYFHIHLEIHDQDGCVVEDIPMAERSWLYTAMTRAKRKVIIITTKNGIKNAVERGFKAEQLNVRFHL
tara:strand:- start:1364 stop:1567 length:204 start_codon:yes stop_codon:yes gene_type:complete